MKAENNEKLNTDQLLDGAFECLRNGDFDKADGYCGEVIAADPYNAAAKLYRLMAEQKTRDISEFANSRLPFGGADGSALTGYIAQLSEEYKNDAIYAAAVYNVGKADRPHIESAISLFEAIPDYKDSAELLEKCRVDLAVITEREEAERKEIERQKEEARAEKERQIKAVKKLIAIGLPCAVFIIALSLLISKVIIPEIRYNSAAAAYGEGNYEEAISVFKKLNGYKDSTKRLTESIEAYRASKYAEAEALLDANEPYGAAKAFYEAIGYKDAKQRFDEIAKCEYTKEYYRDGSLFDSKDVTFDDKGNVIKAVWTSNNTGYVRVKEFAYNDKREPIKENYEDYNIYYDEHYNGFTREYKYDDDHNIISYLYTDSDGGSYFMEYFYNEKGDMIKEVKKDGSGEITDGYYYEYVYDGNGNITNETHSTLDGKYISSYETSYDNNGRIIKTARTYDTGFEGDRKLQQYAEEYFYDNNGNMIMVVYTSESDPDYNAVDKYSYDEKGNKTKQLYLRSDGRTLCYESVYDDNGNHIKITETGYDGTVNVTEYEYNDKGNVVKKTETSSGGSVSVTENFYDDKENLIRFTETENGELVRGFSYGDFVIVLLDQTHCLY